MVCFEKKSHIEIVDKYEGEAAAKLFLMFSSRPVIEPKIITIPGVGLIEVVGAGTPELEEIKIVDSRLLSVWPDVLYRLHLPIESSTLKLIIK